MGLRKQRKYLARPNAEVIWQTYVSNLENDHTRKNYLSVMSKLEDELGSITGQESAEEILGVVRVWQRKGLSSATLRGRLSIIKAVYGLFVKANLRSDNPINKSWIRRERVSGNVRCPDRSEVLRLDQVMDGLDGFIGARDCAIMGFMRYGGLRIFELASLEHQDIEKQGGQIIAKIKGKCRITTRVTLLPQLSAILDRYLEYIPKKHRIGPLFIPEFKPGNSLSVRAIRKRCDYYFKLAKWRRGLSPHSWRHFLAVTLLEGGIPLTEVSRILRHQFLATTFHYYQDVASLRNPTAIKDIPKLLNLKY